METAKEIRYRKLETLIEELGTIEAVASRAGTAPQYLSQIRNKVLSSTGTPRGIGEKLARKLESACGKPFGWMDRDDLSGTRPAIADQEPPTPSPRKTQWEGIPDGPALEAALRDLGKRASPRSQAILANLITLANQNALTDDDWEAIQWIAQRIGR